MGDLFAEHRPRGPGDAGTDDDEPVAVPDVADVEPDDVSDPESDPDAPPVASDPVVAVDPVVALAEEPSTDVGSPTTSSTTTQDPAPGGPATHRADDPDATTVVPLPPDPIRSARSRAHTSPDVWDTGSIRRWDPSMTDKATRMADSSMPRPDVLEDRAEVDLRDDDPGGRWYEVPLMILTALVLAFLLRTFVVQVFYIPSGSMIPTLEINDRIAVEKLSYLARDPRRGEVVVFAGDDPLADTTTQTTADQVITGLGQFLGVVPVDAKDFVKRVIGLPGDTVVLDAGVVSVNGVELDEPYAMLDRDNGEWTVPAGMLFVMGDNRANSGDSRSSLGYIAVDDVVGRAVVTIWPLDRGGSIPGEDHDAAVDAGS